MKIKDYTQIARKYGLNNFIPVNEIDTGTPLSMTLLDYGVDPTSETLLGNTLVTNIAGNGDGDWIDLSANGSTSTAMTLGNALLPGSTKGILWLGAFKPLGNDYTKGQISFGNPASGSVISFTRTGLGTADVVVQDILGNSITINCTEVITSGTGFFAILLNRATGDVTVYSGRASIDSAETVFASPSGTENLSNGSPNPVSNIIPSNMYVANIEELHPQITMRYASGSEPTLTTDAIVNYLRYVISDGEWFTQQVRDFDKGLDITWAGESKVDMP